MFPEIKPNEKKIQSFQDIRQILLDHIKENEKEFEIFSGYYKNIEDNTNTINLSKKDIQLKEQYRVKALHFMNLKEHYFYILDLINSLSSSINGR
jgi:hypothetical protein